MRTLNILLGGLLAAHLTFAQAQAVQPPVNSISGDSITFVSVTAPQREFIANMLRSAREWAQLRTGVALDGSEGSVADLEAVLASTGSWLKTPDLDLVQQRTEGSCLAYGIYLGQVLVDKLEAEWGTTRESAETSGELAVRTKGARHILIYPIRRVCSRITEGPQYSVIDYYKAAITAAAEAQ